ncbi:MAG TPA: helix-turn-helix transcriptional regulator [Tepidisphaeraceae bacterium]|nr:helix-turn-helix transcriptional regulator [Tepidisphaeraceae bacterium]
MPLSNENIIAQVGQRALLRIGRAVADYRGRKGQILTQEKLAEALGVSRTVVAHLEEGRELPDRDKLSKICEHLNMPPGEWAAATHPFYKEGYVFHELTCELLGRRVSLTGHSATDQLIALDRAETLFREKLTPPQAHAQVNALLVFYGERPVTQDFFDRYLGIDAFRSNIAFLERLRQFQSEAMRLYGNFRRAFTCMSRVSDLKAELEPIEQRFLDRLKERIPFTGIKTISSDRLADLGYIAAQRITTQNQERLELSESLKELAVTIEKSSADAALTSLSAKRLSRIRTLLRRFDSSIQLESGLFAIADPVALKEEATRVAPAETDLTRISATQHSGLHNLGVYLSEPYMDVYVATSMREDADFQSVNAFIEQLFDHPSVKPLNLRFFNPTQSWIEDRVSKGLVEALMLRRAAVTVYMAQKGDTFGKDSEASVALGQGKTVIVYVPRLFESEAGIDSEHLFRLEVKKLDEKLATLAYTADEGLDAREKARVALKLELERLTEDQFKRLVLTHWADFDLHAECRAIDNANLRKASLQALSQITSALDDDAAVRVPVESAIRAELTDKLVMVADRFESRAKLFRDTHPLSLQVIVRSGVLNGILVTRSVGDCARLLRGVLANALDFEVEVDDTNYRLVEKVTRSTIRVVSRHRLLTFAFWSQYFDPENFSLPPHELPAGTL